MAAEIFNLRRARKKRLRADKEAEADRNRKRFGRSKADRRLDEAEREREARVIEGHWREGAKTDNED